MTKRLAQPAAGPFPAAVFAAADFGQGAGAAPSGRPLRLMINGFGRIGRTILRQVMTPADAGLSGAGTLGAGIEIVAINDIAPLDVCAYLFEYDSVFGRFPGRVSLKSGALTINGRDIPFHDTRDISTLDLSHVDVVLECTGLGGQRVIAARGLAAGARQVLVSGPSDQADVTVVLGANDADLADHLIVSNASCTTNALAPLARVLDAAYGIVTGQMTTIHCYTNAQPSVDAPRDAMERSRAAALSMVPTTTSASKLLGRVLPHLHGRIEARALRVPTASVSAIDLTVVTREQVDVAAVNVLLAGMNGPILGYTDAPLVSSDLRARPQSLVIQGDQTSRSNGGMLRVFGWYDNEWGFSARMLDMARLMGARDL